MSTPIVAVYSLKGGVGKTTLSVNLAVALARSGSRVGLIDGDIYGPNVPIMLGLALFIALALDSFRARGSKAIRLLV